MVKSIGARLLILVNSIYMIYSQESQKFDFSPSQINVLYGDQSVYLGIGAVGLAYGNKKVEGAIRFIASIRYGFGLTKPNLALRPLMGIGAQFKYKKINLIPAALYFVNSRWEYAAGIGYYLQNRNKK